MQYYVETLQYFTDKNSLDFMFLSCHERAPE